MKKQIKTYKRKPEEVKAIQFTFDNIETCKKFVGTNLIIFEGSGLKGNQYYIRTNRGLYHLEFGSYILKSLKTNSYRVLPKQEFTKRFEIK